MNCPVSRYLDAHTHLQQLSRDQFTDVLDRALQAQVQPVFLNSTTPDEWESVATYAHTHPACIPFFGIHPWNAHLPFSRELCAKHLSMVPSGIGEIGLDKSKQGAPWHLQCARFEEQLACAVHYQKPIVLHCVRSWSELLAILNNHQGRSLRCMVHSYHGGSDLLSQLIDRNMYISFSPKSMRYERFSTMVKRVPLDRLLIESDFPDSRSPDTHLYPDCLISLYNEIADILHIERELLLETVGNNGTIFAYGTIARET